MISSEKALEIAKGIEPEVAIVQEFSDARYFTLASDDEEPRAGGGGYVIVEKKTGHTILWPDYFLDDERDVIEMGEPREI